MSDQKRRRKRANATGRSDYERFVALPHYMLRSPAWKSMDPNAKALLIEVKARFNGFNNGEIAYSVREAADIGLSPATASRAFAALTGRGFLKVARGSHFDLKTKESRTWILTCERFNGEQATKDFMRWPVPEAKPEKTEHSFTHETVRFHQRNRGTQNEGKLPVSVSQVKPSEADSTLSRFHQRNTSISTMRGPGNGNAASPQPPAKQRRHVGTKPNGKQIDLEEAIEAAAAESKAIPTNFGETANGGKRPWSTPRIIAAPHDARTFGLWLAEERGRLGMTMAQLGDLTRLGAAGIETIEAGRATISRRNRKRIIAALNVEVAP